jgi:hypothetical protein
VEYAIARDHGLVAVEERAAIPPTVQDRVKGTEESRGRKPLINLGAGQVDQAGGVHHQLSAYRSPTSAPLPRPPAQAARSRSVAGPWPLRYLRANSARAASRSTAEPGPSQSATSA